MLTALRRRLTLLMTALTSLVLAGALVVTWNYAAAQYRTAAETLLTQNFSAIVDRLDSADSVSDAWLADQEHNSGCLLFLWDNGAALHFAGTTGSADARNAVEPLLEEGLSPLLDTSLHDSSGAVQRQSAVFTLNEYRCHAALLPRGTAGSYLLVAALQDMGFVHRHAVQTVVQYGAIWFTGTLLLAIISWRLTGKALAPTALAMRRQKEFIAAAGHELRSPLAVVKASLDAACRTPVTERATLLRNAEQETDRMARLVEDLLVLANGMAGNEEITAEGEDYDNFCKALHEITTFLAKKMAGDGEGATALFETKVINAVSKEDARTLAKSVICSSLTKAAIFGHDANWGRILCALGYSGAKFDPENVDLYFESKSGKIHIFGNGVACDYSEEEATKILSDPEVTALVDMHMGEAEATAWGCDLSYDYVKINADYRS